MVYSVRLKEAMGDMHPQKLADELGVSLQAVRKVLQGKSAAFDVPNHFRACRFLQIDPTWLATGEGSMRSGLTWPLGTRVTPAQFYRLDSTTVTNALDMLAAAAARLGETSTESDDQGLNRDAA